MRKQAHQKMKYGKKIENAQQWARRTVKTKNEIQKQSKLKTKM